MRALAILAVVAIAGLAFAQRVQAWPPVRSVDTRTYDLAGNAAVEIGDVNGDVAVSGWDEDKVEVTTTKRAWSNDDLQRLDTRVDAHSDRFSVAAMVPSPCWNCDVALKLRVPMHAHITIDTSSGDVSVSSLAGPARVESSSGDVAMRDVGGEVHAHTSSGDITLDGIGSSVDAFASSGDIKAKRLSADVNLVASSGSVSADFVRFDAVHAVRMESSSGDVALTVPRGVGFTLQATTSSGSIDSNLDLPVHERDSGADVSAKVGDGKASVQLRATSGDIAVTMR